MPGIDLESFNSNPLINNNSGMHAYSRPVSVKKPSILMRKLTATRFSQQIQIQQIGKTNREGSKTALAEIHFFLDHAGNITYVLIYRKLKHDP